MTRLLKPLTRLAAAVSVRQQKASGLWDPAPWGAAINSLGHLEMDGVDLTTLVPRYGSPVLAVSRSKLARDARAFHAALEPALPGSIAAFSYKTNCIPGVLRELHGAGFAAEVISPYELWLAERLGVPGNRIVVNGVNKGYDYLLDAVRVGALSINIDHPDELEDLKKAARRLQRKARLSLRLKVDRESHFGLGIESGEAERLAHEIARFPNLFEFSGLHFHAVADNDDPRLHVRYLLTALRFAARLQHSLGLRTSTLNIGGGYTIPTMKVMSRWEYARQRLLGVPASPPDPRGAAGFEAYARELAKALEAFCSAEGLNRPRIILEPGRIVTSQSHVLLTKVHSIKPNASGPEFAMTDAGKILTSYPCDYEYHQMFVANRMRNRPERTYHLMGRLCTSADWLAKHRCLPRLEPGDIVAIMDAGAYFTSYASNFAFPRPEAVMADEGGSYVLRNRETFEHLTAMDVVDDCDADTALLEALPQAGA